MTKREQIFFNAAKEYARLMTRDARNAFDTNKVNREIDKSRWKFYEAYRALFNK